MVKSKRIMWSVLKFRIKEVFYCINNKYSYRHFFIIIVYKLTNLKFLTRLYVLIGIFHSIFTYHKIAFKGKLKILLIQNTVTYSSSFY